jgi:hypothetical protein
MRRAAMGQGHVRNLDVLGGRACPLWLDAVSSTVKEWAVQIAIAATALPCEAVDFVG